jgi:phospholipase C
MSRGSAHVYVTVRNTALTLLAAACLLAAAPPRFLLPGVAARVADIRAAHTVHTAFPIQHVIFVFQENRSFNNLFMGFPGAVTQDYGYDQSGNKIPLHATNMSTAWDIDHSANAFFAACDGTGSVKGTDCKLDGWNGESVGGNHPANFAYAFVPRHQTAPYWKMAKSYVLGDNTFQSNLDGSFIAHQYIIAAYASSAVNYPETSWGCEGGSQDEVMTLQANRAYGPFIPACFDNPTIGSEADAAGVSWRFYTGTVDGDGGLWSSYQANPTVHNGPDWKKDVINPPSQFLTDIGKGKLANITWVTPTFEDSDHPGFNSSTGPAWVTSVVNAVGQSKFWGSSAIFIMWDDWGGWFDPVQPIYEDYDGLGFRVPLIVISPYAKKKYVTHVQYETASVLRFMEDDFGLGQLAPADTRANDPAFDAFSFSQQPRAFKPFAGGKTNAFWQMQERLSRFRGIPKTIIGSD